MVEYEGSGGKRYVEKKEQSSLFPSQKLKHSLAGGVLVFR
jgi:hypothetical protein